MKAFSTSTTTIFQSPLTHFQFKSANMVAVGDSIPSVGKLHSAPNLGLRATRALVCSLQAISDEIETPSVASRKLPTFWQLCDTFNIHY